MTENEIASIIIDTCYHMHVELGPGLLESVYEEVLCYELDKLGLQVERQKELPITWDGKKLKKCFRTDLIVEKSVIVELKSVKETEPVHYKILLTYLKLSNLKLGLLINFGFTEKLNRIL